MDVNKPGDDSVDTISTASTTGALAASLSEDVKKSSTKTGRKDGLVTTPASGRIGEAGSGRLSALVPTLGRFATRAQKASAPYLTYAAMASQEAARYACACACDFVEGSWHMVREVGSSFLEDYSAKVDVLWSYWTRHRP